jgi:hypothetical protein
MDAHAKAAEERKKGGKSEAIAVGILSLAVSWGAKESEKSHLLVFWGDEESEKSQLGEGGGGIIEVERKRHTASQYSAVCIQGAE